MASPKRKIIQKRVRKRERYARMARIRHRREKNAFFAIVEDLTNFGTVPSQVKIYRFSMGLVVGEKDGKIIFDVSMVNSHYISNCISVLKEEDKLLCIQLHRNTSTTGPSDEEILKEWEERGDPYWTEWASRIKQFIVTYKEFLDKNKDKFQSEKYVDLESIERYKAYTELRSKAMTSKACVEIKGRFDGASFYLSDIVFSSKFITSLNYEFEEFRDNILREGLPRLAFLNQNKDLPLMHCLENFDSKFSKTVELPTREDVLVTKDQALKKMNITPILLGYFYKGGAEYRHLLTFEEVETLPMSPEITVLAPSERLTERLNNKENERKMFLEKFYPNMDLKYEVIEDDEEEILLEKPSPLHNSVKINYEEEPVGKIKEEMVTEHEVSPYNQGSDDGGSSIENRSVNSFYIPKATYSKNLSNISRIQEQLFNIYSNPIQPFAYFSQHNLFNMYQ